MTDDDNLDIQLREYLLSEMRAREQGNTIGNLRLEVANLRLEVRQLVNMIPSINARIAQNEISIRELTERVDLHQVIASRHHDAIIALRHRARRDENDDEMSPGGFDVSNIQQQVDELREKRMQSERARAEDVTWWKRSAVLWVIGAIGAVLLTLLNAAVTLLLRR